MQIDIVFDTICPWCFIGKRRMEIALSERPHLTPDITWHAFLLNPDMPPGGMNRQDYLRVKFGGEARSRRVNQAISDAGATAGVSFSFDDIQRTPNTIDSHRLVRFADLYGCASAAIEAIYFAYFLNGKDISDHEVLFEVAVRLGLDVEALRAYLHTDADVDDIRDQNAKAHRLGVSGVPAFIIDGQFAISGAQEPAIFHRLFDVAEEAQRELMTAGAQPF